MTIAELKNNPDYIHHHTASRRGYISRKSEGIVKPYSGKFGEGYVVMQPRWDTTQYYYIQYFIKKVMEETKNMKAIGKVTNKKYTICPVLGGYQVCLIPVVSWEDAKCSNICVFTYEQFNAHFKLSN